MNKEQPKDKPSTKHETPKTTTDPHRNRRSRLKSKILSQSTFAGHNPEEVSGRGRTDTYVHHHHSHFIVQSSDKKIDVAQRTPWAFRHRERNAYRVDLTRWSELNIRYSGVFWTIKKIRGFDHRGLYESHSDHGSGSMNATSTEGNAKTQSHVVYALLTELVDGLKMKGEVRNGNEKWIELRPRLFNCQMEYGTGYRAKFKDDPITAGFLSLHFFPGGRADHTVLPISTTEHDTHLEDALTHKFKLLLGQFLQNIAPLKPPGDKLPNQEVFLIGLHGSRLHILRAIFPGHKTSLLWCGRYSPSSSSSDLRNSMEEMGIGKSSDDDDTTNIFQILGSAEYNMWVESDFHEAVRALVGLMMYLMSGEAHCGPLEATFNSMSLATNRDNRQHRCNNQEERYTRAEETGNHENQRTDIDAFEDEVEGRLALTRVEANDQKKESKREIKRRKKEEKLHWMKQMGHGSAGHRIASFEEFRKAWWKWYGVAGTRVDAGRKVL